jgi:hypothetical protein
LGKLTNLTGLDFRENRLSGAVPPEMGNMTSLTALSLGSNPLSGPLPHSLMNLELSFFAFRETDLCEPTDAAFQAWLASIPIMHRTGIPCPEWRILLPLIIRPG